MNITVDLDKRQNYEFNSTGRKLFNLLFVPFLNALPAHANKFVKGSHESVKEVVENATTHHALEVLYKKGHKDHSKGFIKKIIHKVWFDTNNSKAVRNRLKLTKREIKGFLNQLLIQRQSIAILSIASGSARAIIESLNESNLPEEKKVNVCFLDKNPKALTYSKELLKGLQLNESQINCSWVNDTAGSFLNKQEHATYDIVEMVGLIDYFDDGKTLDLFRKIFEVIRPGGFFITANICHNDEETFLTKVVGWPMIYRSAEELGSLLEQAGFHNKSLTLYYEPLMIHTVAVARKE